MKDLTKNKKVLQQLLKDQEEKILMLDRRIDQLKSQYTIQLYFLYDKVTRIEIRIFRKEIAETESTIELIKFHLDKLKNNI